MLPSKKLQRRRTPFRSKGAPRFCSSIGMYKFSYKKTAASCAAREERKPLSSRRQIKGFRSTLDHRKRSFLFGGLLTQPSRRHLLSIELKTFDDYSPSCFFSSSFSFSCKYSFRFRCRYPYVPFSTVSSSSRPAPIAPTTVAILVTIQARYTK
ncbi:hypothetical protein ALCH109712_11785 [Alkalicoccus chagannorensis]